MKARIDEKNWIRCGKCSHKLGLIKSAMPMEEIKKAFDVIDLEIKCHSCKTINTYTQDEK